MNYQCSEEFIIALRDIAQICLENNTDNLILSFDLSDNRQLCVDISFEVEENNDDKKCTNADRIRSMSDEELADIILCPYDTAGNPIEIMLQKLVSPDNCKKCMIEWLQSEVEE